MNLGPGSYNIPSSNKFDIHNSRYNSNVSINTEKIESRSIE